MNDLINKKFEQLLGNQYLTENISLLLYSIVRTYRPVKSLEIGAGYSTLCIAKAFQDIKEEILVDDNDPNVKIYLKNSNKTGESYNPTITVIDNKSGSAERVDNLNSSLNQLNLLKYIEYIEEDGMQYLNSMKEFYDFIWIDFTSGIEYREIFKLCFQQLNQNGIIAFHNTATNAAGRLFLSDLNVKSKICDDFEMITFLEPHKRVQNSITIIKKKMEYPIYYPIAL